MGYCTGNDLRFPVSGEGLPYVGIAQIADMPQGRRLSYDFALSEAKKRENAEAVSELETIGPPPMRPSTRG
jgi:hypothetical protein